MGAAHLHFFFFYFSAGQIRCLGGPDVACGPPVDDPCYKCFLFLVILSAELMFLETSALTGENVEEGFLKCARSILNKIDSGTLPVFVKEVCQRSWRVH